MLPLRKGTLSHYERSLKAREDLLRDNPQSGQAARDVSVSLERLGRFDRYPWNLS